MKKTITVFLLNIIPILIVMSVIFIASSQSSDQQDLSPVLDRVTDRNFVKENVAMVMDRVDRIVERGISVAKNRPNVALAGIVAVALVIAAVFFRLFRSSDSRLKKAMKAFIYTGILFMFALAGLALLKSDAIIELVRSHGSFNTIVAVLDRVHFTYAGSEISLERLGVDGLLTFLIRKAAHLTLFGLLGFFVFLLAYRFNKRTVVSFVIAMTVVVAYAALDEYRQTFIPSRSGIVEDVILDSVGGFIGTTVALMKVTTSSWWDRK
ncbi:VanZ family protein [Alteribacter aurantiacus]|uniref:VanZ family protein n=1 Tax=Alteribacter aurantiacus TaxID=254410 RepID=UPI0003FC6CEF|nr:VanZ family protein [Alteribacter aurantiacus]